MSPHNLSTLELVIKLNILEHVTDIGGSWQHVQPPSGTVFRMALYEEKIAEASSASQVKANKVMSTEPIQRLHKYLQLHFEIPFTPKLT